MKSTRREFVVGAAAAPLLYGLPGAAAQDATPAWLPGALWELRKGNRLGLVVRLPKEPERRCRLGHDLLQACDGSTGEARAVLAGLVVLCLEDIAVLARFPAAEGQALLVDPALKVLEVRKALFPGPESPAAALIRFVDGPERARARQRAEAVRTAIDAETLRLATSPESDADVDAVVAQAGTLLPLLADGLRGPSGLRIREAIDRYHASLAERALPYGVRIAKGGNGCGRCCDEARREGGIECGLGRADPNARSFSAFVRR